MKEKENNKPSSVYWMQLQLRLWIVPLDLKMKGHCHVLWREWKINYQCTQIALCEFEHVCLIVWLQTERRRFSSSCLWWHKKKLATEWKTRSDAISDTDIDIVKRFYQNDDTSRICPGKKDVVTIPDAEGKQQMQKRIMIMNNSETFELFVKDHPNAKSQQFFIIKISPH